jgi:site-specific recombinase XerD
MDDTARRFLTERRLSGTAPATLECYERDLGRFWSWLESEGRPTAVDAIRREDVVDFIGHLGSLPKTERRRNPMGTAAIAFRSLRSFWNWLIEVEDVPADRSPMRGVSAPRVPEVPVPILAEDEITRLLDTVRKSKDLEARRDYAILRVFLDTGARLGEVVGLTVEDYDDENGLLRIRRETSKSKRERVLYLSAETQVALGRWVGLARPKMPEAARTSRMWVSRKGYVTDSGVSQIVKRRAKQAGLIGVHPHTLRHTFAHHALASGLTEGDTMKRGGWSSRSMLDRYGKTGAGERSNDAFRRAGFADRW